MGLAGVSAASVAAVSVGVQPYNVARLVPAAIQSMVPPIAVPATPPPPAYTMPPALSSALAQWNSLRQTDSLPFSSYAGFLLANRGWPGETAMRKTAEKAINIDSLSPQEVLSYFRVYPPLTQTGHARFAIALQASGRTGEALEEARRAWVGRSPRRTRAGC